MSGVVTRFAPSPTGRLHLGHAFSALTAWSFAREHGGRFLLRIEDIDPGRCREEYVDAIHEDLAWLGLDWETPVRRQSGHLADYAAALGRLTAMGLTYSCACTRKDIAMSAAAPQGPEDRILYPGTCRGRVLPPGESYTIRLDMAAALSRAGQLTWCDASAGEVAARPELFGDIVLARKDAPTSYHLAVTVDDALQGVTDIIRGDDLFDSTHVHRLLQSLLGLPTPRYRHHPLLTAPDGKRLAKRDKAQTLAEMRAAGMRAEEVRNMLVEPAPLSPFVLSLSKDESPDGRR